MNKHAGMGFPATLLLLCSLLGDAAHADKGDCSAFAGNSSKYSACIARKDSINERRAIEKKAEKPIVVQRNVSSQKQAQREREGHARSKELHFARQKSTSAAEAKIQNGLPRKPKGTYGLRLEPGDRYRETKVAGAHGNKREILVDRKNVNRNNTTAMKPYKK